MNLPKNIRSDVADRTVRIVAPAMIIGMLVLILTVLLDGEQQNQRLIPGLILIFTMIPPWILALKGKPIAGAIIIIISFCLGILSGMIFSGGVQAPAYIGILVLITIIIVLFGTRGGIIFAVLSFSVGGLFIWFDFNGMLHHVDIPSPFFIFVLLAVLLVMQFCYVLIPVRLMDKALIESQEKGIKLQQTITELKKSEEEFRNLFNSISDLIYKQDMEGRFILVNPAIKQLFGYEMEEFIGHRPSKFMKPELQYEFDSRYLEVIKKQGHHEGIARYCKKNKEEIYIEYQSSLIKPDDDKPYINGIGRDVTEKVLSEKKVRKLQEQVTQAQKMESIGTLAGGIAHDFNNILYPIIGFTQLSQSELPKEHPVQENLTDILNGAKRARDVVKRILLFSRQKELELKPIILQPIIQESHKLLRSSIPTNINLVLDLYDGKEFVLCDASEIHEIILNLCTNSYHAIVGDKGEIIISLKKQNSISELKLSPGEYLCLSVKDNGVGIPEKIRDKIFEPYVTTKDVGKGSGLGLSVVYGIVENYNGSIRIESDSRKGTEIKIFLPITTQVVAEEENQENKGLKTRGNERILFVDDEGSIVKLGVRALENSGYKVTGVKDSTKALEIFKSNPENFDLIITDMAMPGMVGSELSKKILDIRSDLPIIICSGYSENLDKMKAKGLKVSAFLDKPLSVEDLVKNTREVLDKHTTG
jgi:PAS domain S-box-containing protein